MHLLPCRELHTAAPGCTGDGARLYAATVPTGNPSRRGRGTPPGGLPIRGVPGTGRGSLPRRVDERAVPEFGKNQVLSRYRVSDGADRGQHALGLALLVGIASLGFRWLAAQKVPLQVTPSRPGF